QTGGKGAIRGGRIRRRRLPQQPVEPRASGRQVRGLPEGGRARESERGSRATRRIRKAVEGNLLALRQGSSRRRRRGGGRLRSRPRTATGARRRKEPEEGRGPRPDARTPPLRGQTARRRARLRLEPRRAGETALRPDRRSGARPIRPPAERR